MRVKLSKTNLEKLFRNIKRQNIILANIATGQKVSIRTITDWKSGKSTIPLKNFKALLNISGIKDDNLSPKLLPAFWHIKEAGKKGAVARMEIYGNPGTPDGRSRGGLAAIKTHKKKGRNNFSTLKTIIAPKHSKALAEFMGVIIGDGHLSEYQASITTNSQTDKEHAVFVKKTINKLFGISATIKEKINENAITITASSRSLVKFLNKQGMPIGNKLKNNLAMPVWVIKNKEYQKSFIRGLFDTDGCIYVDSHKIKGKNYKNLGWTITSYADKLKSDVIATLSGLGFSPTYRNTQKSVYLRRHKEIVRYFSEIGTSNPKHYNRYKNFFNGRVPKWS